MSIPLHLGRIFPASLLALGLGLLPCAPAQGEPISGDVTSLGRDWFTQQIFNNFDLENRCVTFTPVDGLPPDYVAHTDRITELPTDPEMGSVLVLGDDSSVPIEIADGREVWLWGEAHTTVHVSSNGYVTFGEGDTDFSEALIDHFRLPRVSALFDDLAPSAGGSVRWSQTDDRVAITWVDVPQYRRGDANTFQIEMFFDGRIRISHLNIEADDCIVGLSSGQGLPDDFTMSDLSAYPALQPEPPVARALDAVVYSGIANPVILPGEDPNADDPLTWVIETLPMAGALSDPNSDLTIASIPHELTPGERTVLFTPDPGSRGGEAFVYHLTDGTFVSASETVHLTVTDASELGVSPASFHFTVPEGGTQSSSLRVFNTGLGTGIYSITVNEVDPPVAGAAVSAASTAPEPIKPDWGAEHAPDRLLVVYEDGTVTTQALRISLHQSLGATMVRHLGLIDADVVEVKPGGSLQTLAQEYLARPGVDHVQPDFIYHASLMPNDAAFPQLYGLDNHGQTGGVTDADIDAPEAWDVTTGSDAIIVGVIDSGVDYNHPDLAANMWVNTQELNGVVGLDDDGNGYVDDVHGYDFVNDDSDPWDDNSHGTHVSGTIGAVGNNALGVVGVNWNVRIMALKFLDNSGDGFTSDAISCLEYAIANGAHLTNNSWGGGGTDPALYAAILAASEAGQIFVAASGNGAANSDVTPEYPAAYDLDSIISVAATDRSDLLASFSNYGAISVDLAAPGNAIFSTLPSGLYGYKSGTSMSSPHVAGVVALLLSLSPDATPAQLREWILGGVDQLPSLAGRVATGGRLNAFNSAILAGPRWLRVGPPRGGELAAGAEALIPVTALADRIAVGDHHAVITVRTNDPITPVTEIPVTLTVTSNPMPPTAESFSVTVPNSRRSLIQLRGDDPNVGDTLDSVIASLPSDGELLDTGIVIASVPHTLADHASALEYRPTAGSVASVEFLYEVTDGIFTSNSASVAIQAVEVIDPLTEEFAEDSQFDLENLTVTFTPASVPAGYTVRTELITSLPTDPTGGAALAFAPTQDDGSALVSLTGGAQVAIHGSLHSDFHVGSNGYITFGTGDSDMVESLEDHFSLPRVSALFDDLDPSQGGAVTWRQLSDRVAVTWERVPEFGFEGENTFQIELLFDGTIRLSYLRIDAADGLAGLSDGQGVPQPFEMSDLSSHQSLLGWTYQGGGAAAGSLGPLFPGDPSVQSAVVTDDDGDNSGVDLRITIGDPAGSSFVGFHSSPGVIPHVASDTIIVDWDLATTLHEDQPGPAVVFSWHYGAVGEIGGGSLVAHQSVAPAGVLGTRHRMVFDQMDVDAFAETLDRDGVSGSGDEVSANSITLGFEVIDFESDVGDVTLELNAVTIRRIPRESLLSEATLERAVSSFADADEVRRVPPLNWSASVGGTADLTQAGFAVLTTPEVNGEQSPPVLDLFGNSVPLIIEGAGLHPFTPSVESGRFFRASFGLDGAPASSNSVLPLTRLTLATFNEGQALTSEVHLTADEPGLLPQSPGVESLLPGNHAVYLHLPEGQLMGADSRLGDSIGTYAMLIDTEDDHGGTLTINAIEVTSFPESILP